MKRTPFLSFPFLLFLQSYGQSKTEPSYPQKGSLSLRTNIVPWLTQMPNSGKEDKYPDNIGLIIDQMDSINKDTKTQP